ncbi:unnamed protein product [Leuciscus chuanchicus]
MPNQRERKRGQESTGQKLNPDTSIVTSKAGNALVDSCHDYTSTSLPLATAEDFMEEFPLIPITPSKSPAPKKKMMSTVMSEQTNTNDIIASLSALINTRSDNIESM